jgi:hypothetical protein
MAQNLSPLVAAEAAFAGPMVIGEPWTKRKMFLT